MSEPLPAHPFDRLPDRVRFFRAALASVAIGIGLAVLAQFFGLEEGAQRLTARVYGPLLSAGYPAAGRERIAVVTIDDEDLRLQALNWPVPLDFHARAIDAFVDRRPKAIFLDIAFLDARPPEEVDALADAACRSLKAGVPVFIVEAKSPVENRLLSRSLDDGRTCIRTVAAGLIVDRHDRSAWEYPLVAATADGLLPSAALALALACAERDSGCMDEASVVQRCARDRDECRLRDEDRMALIWGVDAASSNAEILVDPVAHAPLCRPTWSRWEAVPLLNRALRLLGAWKLPLCPYNAIVPLRALMLGYGFSPSQLEDALGGRYLLVGTDFRGSSDRIHTPFHGTIPGVHLHAMALDNLLTYRGEFRDAAGFDWRRPKSAATVFTAVTVLLITLLMIGWDFARKRLRERLEHRLLGTQRQPAGTLHAADGGAAALAPTASARSLLRPLSRHLAVGVAVMLATIAAYAAGSALILVVAQLGDGVGPLALAEFIVFPLAAHFVHLGERTARFEYLIVRAFRDPAARAYLERHGLGGPST